MNKKQEVSHPPYRANKSEISVGEVQALKRSAISYTRFSRWLFFTLIAAFLIFFLGLVLLERGSGMDIKYIAMALMFGSLIAIAGILLFWRSLAKGHMLVRLKTNLLLHSNIPPEARRELLNARQGKPQDA